MTLVNQVARVKVDQLLGRVAQSAARRDEDELTIAVGFPGKVARTLGKILVALARIDQGVAQVPLKRGLAGDDQAAGITEWQYGQALGRRAAEAERLANRPARPCSRHHIGDQRVSAAVESNGQGFSGLRGVDGPTFVIDDDSDTGGILHIRTAGNL